MTLQLKFGTDHVDLDLSAFNISPTVLTGKHPPKLEDPVAGVIEAMAHPIGSGTIAEEIARRRAQQAVIVVNDVTRPTPNHLMLPPILAQVEAAGIPRANITLVVATGIHRGDTAEEMAATLGPDIVRDYRVVNHDCDDTDNLTYVGTLVHGTEFYVNKFVYEAQMVITTGVIGPHYFAGFSGGRKSIFPGVSARKSIEHNHSLMKSPLAAVASLESNPVSEEMVDAGRRVDVGFIVNVVVDASGTVCAVVAGDMEQAWLRGVEMCRDIAVTPIEALYDVAIASSGGYPKDINIYQAQKGLDNAQRAVRPGGTVVLVADCSEGYGESTFEDWMLHASTVDDILERFAVEFKLGGHKAYSLARVIKEKHVILISRLPDSTVRQLFMTPAHSMDEALELVRARHGRDFSCVVLPSAGGVVPSLIY
jgi:nickel-dependent lactate racemase